LLLPVVHILPIDIDDSLYHDRWAMNAVALACAFLPAACSTFDFALLGQKRLRLFASLILSFWLVIAAFNVRVTLPLWSNETRLWQWALHDNPDSLIALDNLLAISIENGDLPHARPIARRLLAEPEACLNCLLNAAQVSILDRDAESAKHAIERAQAAMKSRPPSVRQMVNYVSKIGDIRRLQGDLPGAESAYRDAVRLDPMIPVPHLSLATVLAKQGKIAEARRAAEEGLVLLTPDRQQRSRREFEAFLEKTSTGAAR
jgi:tetratricopeptide (TPR) repeat protein